MSFDLKSRPGKLQDKPTIRAYGLLMRFLQAFENGSQHSVYTDVFEKQLNEQTKWD